MQLSRCGPWCYSLEFHTMNKNPIWLKWSFIYSCSSLQSLLLLVGSLISITRLRVSYFKLFLNYQRFCFFSCYYLLVLYWAHYYVKSRIIHNGNGKNLSTRNLRIFWAVIFVMLSCQIALWVVYYKQWIPDAFVAQLRDYFHAALAFFALIGFFAYGFRLYLFGRFKVASMGAKNKKLHQLSVVLCVCTVSFVIRFLFNLFYWPYYEVNPEGVVYWVSIAVFYLVVEVIPSLVLLHVMRHHPKVKKPLLEGMESSSWRPNENAKNEAEKTNFNCCCLRDA